MKIIQKLWIAIAILCFAPHAEAEKVSKKERGQLTSQVEAYLNGITTLTAKVHQVAQNKAKNGKIYISRPGRLQLEYYNAKGKMTDRLVANKGKLVIYNPQAKDPADRRQEFPTASTPADFLLQDFINLQTDLYVKRLDKKNGKLLMTLVRHGEEEHFSLTLFFKLKPYLMLEGWTVEDANAQQTHITLSDVKLAEPLSNKLFRTG